MRRTLGSFIEAVLRRGTLVALGVSTLTGCGAAATPRFPMRAPVWVDTDLEAKALPCRPAPTAKDPAHRTCAPESYVSPLAWDAADNSIFRPLSEGLSIRTGYESVNVNSLDEVPNSAWFTNRIGMHDLPVSALARGACADAVLLDGEAAKDGSWVIDAGKANGSSPGFRIKIPGKGKYLLKSDGESSPERPSAASVIGAATYHAVGFYTSCEQVVYVKRSALKLTPGLTYTDNSEVTRPFDEAALDRVLAGAAKRGEYLRFQASAWLPGQLLGPFRYEGTRADDPNDVIAHDDRRDLRGGRLLAAWTDHFDAREQNSMDSWIADDPKKPAELQPGRVIHYYLDTSDCFGSEWDWDGISRRLGHSYLLDWGDISLDFLTLGTITHPWDTATRAPGHEMFGYYRVADFDPERWINEYPNPSFSRMTERDGAWMARILAHFTPAHVAALAALGRFSDPGQTAHLTAVMEGRLEAILARYLTRLSPLSEVSVADDDLCATDLAKERGVRRAGRAYEYVATLFDDDGGAMPLTLKEHDGAVVCARLPARRGQPRAAIYRRVRIDSKMADGPLWVHLYDRGGDGWFLAGVERKER